ncbi:MAG: PLP-dependent cysteine synthase family protein [Acidobacteria bacterium]|nr:PLP-dependent cysteine synthase family protein [Acidobacteriota bacterium]
MATGAGLHHCSVLDLIGNTPLLDLPCLAPHPSVRVLAKAEWFNPGGSVKDRPARSIILDAEARGALTREKVLLDSTSGNTGIAYAMIGAARGYHVKLVVPGNINVERRRTLRAYGAELVITDPLQGSDGASRVAHEIHQQAPQTYCYADQYNNDANWRAHFQTTGPEIWEQTAGEVTHFVAGMGTSGTFVGTTRFLKKKNTGIEAIAVQPDSPMHGLEGMKHMATADVPGIYDPSLVDRLLEVSTERAQQMVLRLARNEGLLVGITGGAAAAAASEVASTLKQGVVVLIFPDSGSRYLSESFWEEQ